jgi:GH15 family glucan-1,4-alpha-glucosidase
MYGLAGERRLPELELDWLPGYEDSRPVRIGNAAYSQFQLDVFGEVAAALHLAREAGLEANAISWNVEREMARFLESAWQQPDEGIWEVRGPRQHFTYSKAMAWVAFDRMIKSAEQFGLPGEIAHWKQVRDEIHREVCARGYDVELGSFVRAYGSKELDASLLLLPTVGFLPADDRRITGTIRAVEKALFRDGFLLRYDTATGDDGLPPGEGAFLACSFWLADAYVLLGRMDDARALFERLLALRNDLGLLSEEYDVRAKRLVGNFPQAFSHLALINTAANLTKASKPVEQRAGTTEPGARSVRDDKPRPDLLSPPATEKL